MPITAKEMKDAVTTMTGLEKVSSKTEWTFCYGVGVAFGRRNEIHGDYAKHNKRQANIKITSVEDETSPSGRAYFATLSLNPVEGQGETGAEALRAVLAEAEEALKEMGAKP